MPLVGLDGTPVRGTHVLHRLISQAERELDDEYQRRRVFNERRLLDLDAKAGKGDVMAALRAVRLAVEDEHAIPRRSAYWLASGIVKYLQGAKSLDHALGLAARGRASPRYRDREEHDLRAVLSRMMSLQMLGATVHEAAVLVARLSPSRTAATLESNYRRSGYTKGTTAMRKQFPRVFELDGVELEKALAEFPGNTLEAKQAKAAIRRRYVRDSAK